MKKVYYFLVVLMMLAWQACEEKSEDISLNLSTSTLHFSKNGGSETLQIISSGGWNISSLPEWITVSAVSGTGNSNVIVTCKLNETGTLRQSSFIIRTSDNGQVRTVEIKQTATNDINENQLYVQNTQQRVFGGEDSIVIESNVPWTVETPSWLRGAINGVRIDVEGKQRIDGSATLLLLADQNSDKEDRSGVVYIRSTVDNTIIEVPVIQLGAYHVRPVEMVVLANSISFTWKYGCSVTHIFYQLFEGYATEEQKTFDKALKYDGYLEASTTILSTLWNKKSNTTYELCALGVDVNTDEGEISSCFITTPSDINQPIASIGSVRLDEKGWHYRVTKSPNTYGYYVFYNKNASWKNRADSYIAWMLKRELQKKPNSFQLRVNDGAWIYQTTDNLQIITWAIDGNLNFSSVIDRYVCENGESNAREFILENTIEIENYNIDF